MKIAIVGGGAAGLLAACRLSDAGADVTLFERGERPGRKLSITGKGRCNLTNACDVQEVLAAVPTGSKFLFSAMRFFPPEAVMSYFEDDLGVPLKTERGNRVFPVSDKASDIVKALTERIRKNGVRVLHEKVTAIRAENGAVSGLSAGPKDYAFDRVLLCTGGKSYPTTGSDGTGYRLAEALGHTATPLRPSLVPLICRERDCAEMQGLSLKNVGLAVFDLKTGKKIYEDFGEMLFTHFGLSGPIVLSASAHMREMEKGRYTVAVDLKPALDEQTLDRRLVSDFLKYKNRDFANALDDLLPQKMIPVVVARSGIAARKKVNEITKEERRRLGALLKKLTFTVEGFRPIDEAIVTSGGIDLKEVEPGTMQSKLLRGLYFAGEILDVDAYTGGFNLQIAFSTAALAASAILKSESKKENADNAPKRDQNQIYDNIGRQDMKRMNIAIDGPSGAGKSSLAKGLAKHYGIVYVDTGALYRTVGLFAQRKGIPVDKADKVCAFLPELSVSLRYENGEQKMYLFDEDVTGLIRTPEISMYASAVSALPEVRKFLLETQKEIARKTSVVMDGRDIGTVILPDAEVKIFLVAGEPDRARRRYEELTAKGQKVTLEEVEKDMIERDRNDREREAAPAIPAKDAVLLDNSKLTIEETVQAAIAIIEEKLSK